MVSTNLYRFESCVLEELMPNYVKETRYVRMVEIYFLRKEKELFQYQILTTQFDFSNEESASGYLIKKICYLFDQLDIYADQDCNIVKINNLQSIRLKWKELQMDLLKTNKGHAVDHYFRQISEVLEDEKSFIKFLAGYQMFGLYFNGQSGEYPENGKKARNVADENIEYLYRENSSPDNTIIKMNACEENNERMTNGTSIYEDGLLRENFIEFKNKNSQIKYSLLWVG